jgi:chromosome segregation ATPase
MPTNQELQDINDHLLTENERLQEELQNATQSTSQEELRTLYDEIQCLSAELAQSERERSHAQQMLDSLTSAQQSLEKIQAEKQEVLLARLEEESRKMAAERKEWGAQLKAEQQKVKTAQTTAAKFQQSVQEEQKQKSTLQRLLNESRMSGQAKDSEIGRWQDKYEQVSRNLQRLREIPSPPAWIELSDSVTGILAKPGCILTSFLLTILVWGLYLVLSLIWPWIAPSDPIPPLGR